MHADVNTVAGPGLERYREAPRLIDGELTYDRVRPHSRDETVLRPVKAPFAEDGGIRVLNGSLGRAVMKVSAVQQRVIEAPARVFDDQAQLLQAFDQGELDRDVVAVVRHQGPKANGMPELHKLTPALGVLVDRGHKVALVTDGRMSGASGKVPAAIHCTGPLDLLEDGDLIRVDAEADRLDVLADLQGREPSEPTVDSTAGTGRELFAAFRQLVSAPDDGASVFAPAFDPVPA
jgi:phosphogluconate dehydratase